MYALKQMMKEISFTRKNYKLTATKRMNTPLNTLNTPCS